mmetsp:Transcript_18417/g.61655  ORF Transcript_18417/g.61655 Transcript_18417/m.61655 type:complete len:274 (-) Transcript_18417:473-1294(-)
MALARARQRPVQRAHAGRVRRGHDPRGGRRGPVPVRRGTSPLPGHARLAGALCAGGRVRGGQARAGGGGQGGGGPVAAPARPGAAPGREHPGPPAPRSGGGDRVHLHHVPGAPPSARAPGSPFVRADTGHALSRADRGGGAPGPGPRGGASGRGGGRPRWGLPGRGPGHGGARGPPRGPPGPRGTRGGRVLGRVQPPAHGHLRDARTVAPRAALAPGPARVPRAGAHGGARRGPLPAQGGPRIAAVRRAPDTGPRGPAWGWGRWRPARGGTGI